MVARLQAGVGDLGHRGLPLGIDVKFLSEVKRKEKGNLNQQKAMGGQQNTHSNSSASSTNSKMDSSSEASNGRCVADNLASATKGNPVSNGMGTCRLSSSQGSSSQLLGSATVGNGHSAASSAILSNHRVSGLLKNASAAANRSLDLVSQCIKILREKSAMKWVYSTSL